MFKKIFLLLILGIPLPVFAQSSETGLVQQMQQLQEQLPTESKYADFYDKIKANPKDPQLHLQLAKLYLEHQLFELAITSFRQALNLQPGLAEAHVGLSQVFRKKGLKGWELFEMAEALRLDPGNSENIYRLGVLYMEPANFDYKKADRQYKALQKMESPLTAQLGQLMQK